jgi:hypothetical protein
MPLHGSGSVSHQELHANHQDHKLGNNRKQDLGHRLAQSLILSGKIVGSPNIELQS